jgi:hypothetical protein
LKERGYPLTIRSLAARNRSGLLKQRWQAGCGDTNFRIGEYPTRTQRESNKSRRIGEMLATITNPFGASAQG